MDRKKFLQLGFLGTSMIASSKALANLVENNIDELSSLEVIGFNHIPNAMTTTQHNSVLHKADTRGQANHGWLTSRHTFSFANYYNPERMHFGVLRVLNDDIITGGTGFGTHPHDNMEIISIPLSGGLQHKDSMGNTAIIEAGDIQVMSAGTGITHSEYNQHKDKEGRFLQIWMFPNKKSVIPRYDQIKLDPAKLHNQFAQILSPSMDDAGVWVHQNAWFNMGNLEKGVKTTYELHDSAKNGVYAFILEGDATINGQTLGLRDGFGIWDVASLDIQADNDTKILLMEVPMSLS